MPTAGHPVVFAQWLGAAGKPTVLIYGHYDVQPPDPLDKWVSPPFTPTIRDGRLYARGISDDKGPMFQAIKVAQAFFETQGKLPVNIKFMLEGEEEIGSPSLEPFIVGPESAAGRRFRHLCRRRHVARRRAFDHDLQPRAGRAGVQLDWARAKICILGGTAARWPTRCTPSPS